MGGSKPSAPTIIMDPQTQPQKFQTVTPKSSFQDVAETLKTTMEQSAQLDKNRYAAGFSPTDMAVRQAAGDVTSAAAYLGSLPQSDVSTQFQATPRIFDIKSTDSSFSVAPGQVTSKTGASIKPATSQLDAVKKAAAERLDIAKKQYADAVQLAKTATDPVLKVRTDPSFATRDAEEYLPKRYNPETKKMEVV